MLIARRVALTLFVIAGLVAFLRVGMGVSRGTGLNVYEIVMGVLALSVAFVLSKLWTA